MANDIDLNTGQIRNWRSIVTLIVFVVTSEYLTCLGIFNCIHLYLCRRTDIIVLFPFHIPIYIPRALSNAILDSLSVLRIISPRHDRPQFGYDENGKSKSFVRLSFPVNFVTAPLIADLFLLAILAIGRTEVHDGTLGANNISPIDIMVFFLSLAYIAISIDASGLIRFLAFKVLQLGGDVGHRLFFYLYVFFFGLTSFIGNDPIILSGTAFLAYMTRVSSNIVHPRAWIHTQFAVANIGSAILVSSNPTNLVLAGAFDIKFIHYTVNMIVPVVVTAIVLFPFLLYIVFANESLIPISIKMHELPEGITDKKPVNPNIPHSRGAAEEEEKEHVTDDEGKLLSLEEIMNPFVDKGGAAFGAIIMAATLITLLAINASRQSKEPFQVFWVTLPAAVVMFCWDLAFGWQRRHETREIARKGREEVEQLRADRVAKEEEKARQTGSEQGGRDGVAAEEAGPPPDSSHEDDLHIQGDAGGGLTLVLTPPLESSALMASPGIDQLQKGQSSIGAISGLHQRPGLTNSHFNHSPEGESGRESSGEVDEKRPVAEHNGRLSIGKGRDRATLTSLVRDFYSWCQITFPTPTAVVAHLPFALVPFAFTMFVLVQGKLFFGS
jgi:Na+/H+ antiporter NhaD/arsenite permease-like protein